MSERPLRERAEATYRALQDSICAELERLDGVAVFGADVWERPEGGGGMTRVLAEGAVLEKAAVNVSAVGGPAPAQLVEHLKVEASTFFATGISLILHPRNPHAPTVHANLRYFETDGGAAWCGGGADLTPYYLYEEDVRHFHGVLRGCCARHPLADYARWKAWADSYFHLPHRGLSRGVGALFFDHVGGDLDAVLAFQEDLGRQLMPAYLPLLERRKDAPVSAEEERWHLLRRGRYVEFNLLHDRGTRFGLQTGGRTESILVSLPPRVRWDYQAEPAPGSAEAQLLEVLRGPPRAWA